jgi:ribosomal protein S12 methylthiotransferase accessory factor
VGRPAHRRTEALLALAIGDEEAIREGCEWLRHFEQIDPGDAWSIAASRPCWNSAAPTGIAARWNTSTAAPTVAAPKPCCEKRQRFFGIEAPGLALKGCDLHRALLAAYAKLSH